MITAEDATMMSKAETGIPYEFRQELADVLIKAAAVRRFTSTSLLVRDLTWRKDKRPPPWAVKLKSSLRWRGFKVTEENHSLKGNTLYFNVDWSEG